ncbi:lytic transglycosylase domain-containing protein [Phyllobacterium sp. K27]
MKNRIINVLVCMLFLNIGPALAQDNREPVKITVAAPGAVIDPERFGPASPAKSCVGASPIDARQGEAIVRKVAEEEEFDADLLVAIARRESGFRMESVSDAGAVGLMQLMPDTAKRFQVDICDPEDNGRGGIRYLRLLQKKYQNPIYVLAAYNAGESAVERNGGLPLYPETVQYVSAVLTDLYGWQPFAKGSPRKRAHQSTDHNQTPDGNPETWSQGFVLHVE